MDLNRTMEEVTTLITENSFGQIFSLLQTPTKS